MQMSLFECIKNTNMTGDPNQSFFMPDWELKETRKVTTLGKDIKTPAELLLEKSAKYAVNDISKISYKFNSDHLPSKQIEYAVTRIRKKYTLHKVFKDKDLNEIKELIESECTDDYVKVEVHPIDDEDAVRLLDCFSGDKGVTVAKSPVELRIIDLTSAEAMHCYGFLDIGIKLKKNLKSKYSGRIKRSSKSKIRTVVDVPYMVSELLFFKQVRRFMRGNFEITKEIFLKDFACQVAELKMFGMNYSEDSIKTLFDLSRYPVDFETGEYDETKVFESMAPSAVYPGRKYHKILDQKAYEYFKAASSQIRVGTTNYFLRTAALDIFCKSVEYASHIKGYEKSMRDFSGKYARYYEDKQNIPKKIMKAMDRSVLHEYFGYIEYDEKTDLDKVRSYEREISDFITNHMPKGYREKLSQWDFRVRRLGKQKNKGMADPVNRVLCVDYRHPDAYVHEQMHVVDFSNGLLSMEPEFDALSKMYIKDIDDYVNKECSDDEFKSMYYSKRKHNREYFCCRLEIFAALGTLYFEELLSESSIVRAEGHKYRCVSNETMKHAREYFKDLFNTEKK